MNKLDIVFGENLFRTILRTYTIKVNFGLKTSVERKSYQNKFDCQSVIKC